MDTRSELFILSFALLNLPDKALVRTFLVSPTKASVHASTI